MSRYTPPLPTPPRFAMVVIVKKRWGQDEFYSEDEGKIAVDVVDGHLKVTKQGEVKLYSPGRWRTVTYRNVSPRAKV